MQRNHTARHTCIETLEERRLFSGVVTATLDFTGTLLIKGDNANNTVEVEAVSAPGFIRVRGFATAVNGVAFVQFPATSVRAINIQLAGGNDTFSVHDMTSGANGTTPSLNSITATDDAGNDNDSFYALTLNTGSISATTGGGVDVVQLSDGLAVGSLSINTGSSNDTVFSFDTHVGTASILTGDQNDNLQLTGSTFGTLSADTGKGDDNAFLGNVTVSSSINVKLGDGNDYIRCVNVVAGFGVIDGGNNTDVFEDGGGNAGFSVINFEGFI
jgi:hypothetical protein